MVERSAEEELINRVGHGLRNLLTALRLHAETLDLLIERTHPARPQVSGVLRELGRILEASEDMLRYGRPFVPAPSRFTVGALADELAAACSTGIRGHTAQLTVDPAAREIEVCWDRRAIREALERLVENAARHTPAPHRVTLTARATDGEVTVEVRDAGEGIEARHLPRITEPFYPQHEGRLGLGLALVEKLVRAHGGCLEVESVRGEGTTVRLVLPREVPGSA